MDILSLFKLLRKVTHLIVKVIFEMESRPVSRGGKRMEPLEDNKNRYAFRKRCPVCSDPMQMSGQKADSNGVIKQRYLCVSCKKAGRSPYNFFKIEER